MHAQIIASRTNDASEAASAVNGLTDNPNLAAMPTRTVNPTMSLGILNLWQAEYDAAWAASAGRYDPYNHAIAQKGFAANREYIAWLDRVADAQIARDLRDFGRIYYDVASTVIVPVAVADTAYRILSGQMTAAEATVAVATLGRGRALRAAEGGSVRIATEGRSIAGSGSHPLLTDIRAAGGTLPIQRGQVGMLDISAASRAGGNEIALFRDRTTRQLFLREGLPTSTQIPLNSRLILHSQPGATAMSVRPSIADRIAIDRLNQRSSVIINSEGTYITRFRSNPARDGYVYPIGR